MSLRMLSLLFLFGLCVLCVVVGVESTLALQTWLRGGAFLADLLKTLSPLLFTFAIFCRLSLVIPDSIGAQSDASIARKP